MSSSRLYCDDVMEYRTGRPASARWTGTMFINRFHRFRMLFQACPEVSIFIDRRTT